MDYINGMATPGPTRDRIGTLKREYDALRRGKESLLAMIDEVEIPESVYNSNAIENSTLTLDETERILMEQTLAREVSVREVFEAKNLARVMEYMRARAEDSELDEELILLLHRMLIGGIDDAIAGPLSETGGVRARGFSHRARPRARGAHDGEHPHHIFERSGLLLPRQDRPVSPGFRDDSSFLRRQRPHRAGAHRFPAFYNSACRASSSATRRRSAITGRSGIIETAGRPGRWRAFWRWRFWNRSTSG